jgi:lysozyme
MTISDDGLDLIKRYEGLRLKAYKCPAGVWTIGYGHTRGVTSGMTITEEIAEALLREDVRPAEKLLNGLHINLRQGQFDALCSWIFNLGSGNFLASTLKKKLVAGAPDKEIVAEIVKWNKATVNGKKVELAGLTRRRAEEAAHFLV